VSAGLVQLNDHSVLSSQVGDVGVARFFRAQLMHGLDDIGPRRLVWFLGFARPRSKSVADPRSAPERSRARDACRVHRGSATLLLRGRANRGTIRDGAAQYHRDRASTAHEKSARRLHRRLRGQYEWVVELNQPSVTSMWRRRKYWLREGSGTDHRVADYDARMPKKCSDLIAYATSLAIKCRVYRIFSSPMHPLTLDRRGRRAAPPAREVWEYHDALFQNKKTATVGLETAGEDLKLDTPVSTNAWTPENKLPP